MPSKYEQPSHRFASPAMVLVRVHRDRYDHNSNPIPVQRIPVQQRMGALRIIWAKHLEASDFEVGRLAYREGLRFRYELAVEAYVEVLSRDKSARDHTKANKRPWMSTRAETRLWMRPNTPLLISREAAINTTPTTEMPRMHTTVLEPSSLRKVLPQVLPYIGVDAADAGQVCALLMDQFPPGRRRLEAAFKQVKANWQ